MIKEISKIKENTPRVRKGSVVRLQTSRALLLLTEHIADTVWRGVVIAGKSVGTISGAYSPPGSLVVLNMSDKHDVVTGQITLEIT